MLYNVIDVSYHNGIIVWNKVKGNCDGVIIRCGYRGYGSSGTLTTDLQFTNNIKGAISAGLKVGVYWLSQAVTTAEAVEEANYIDNLLKPYKAHITFPVYLDSEWSNNNHSGRADSLSKEDRTNISVAFLETVKKAGYTAGIYASKSWFDDKLDDSKLKSYTHWIAQYSKKCTYNGTVDAWQYSDKERINGVSSNVDKSYFYKSFSSTAANTAPTVTKPTTTTVSTVKAGDKVVLKSTKIYATSSDKTSVSTKSGTFYIYSADKVNGRYRITTTASNVGKTPVGNYVTGWIDESVVSGGKATTTKIKYSKGDKIILSNANLYANETSTTPVKQLSGTYYIYDGISCKLSRYRITNSLANCGKKPIGDYVTGYVAYTNFK